MTDRCVLVIDDDPAALALTKLALSRIDPTLKVLAFEGGTAALHHMDAVDDEGPPNPSLVLLDWNLPFMHGREVLEFLRQKHAPQQGCAIIVVVTTSVAQTDIDQAHDLGATDYMVKIPDFNDFCEALKKVVEEHVPPN